jgi:predicted RNase H-like HicB family nuclease
MKPSDQYLKWVEWSPEDDTYVGKCPDTITGIHGSDPERLYAELCEVVEEVIAQIQQEGRPLPPAKVRPMQEIS